MPFRIQHLFAGVAFGVDTIRSALFDFFPRFRSALIDWMSSGEFDGEKNGSHRRNRQKMCWLPWCGSGTRRLKLRDPFWWTNVCNHFGYILSQNANGGPMPMMPVSTLSSIDRKLIVTCCVPSRCTCQGVRRREFVHDFFFMKYSHVCSCSWFAFAMHSFELCNVQYGYDTVSMPPRTHTLQLYPQHSL